MCYLYQEVTRFAIYSECFTHRPHSVFYACKSACRFACAGGLALQGLRFYVKTAPNCQAFCRFADFIPLPPAAAEHKQNV
jgi:hypothetical protein